MQVCQSPKHANEPGYLSDVACPACEAAAGNFRRGLRGWWITVVAWWKGLNAFYRWTGRHWQRCWLQELKLGDLVCRIDTGGEILQGYLTGVPWQHTEGPLKGRWECDTRTRKIVRFYISE